MVVSVFLDQISNFAHVHDENNITHHDKEELWKSTLVQQIHLPDFEHVNIPNDNNILNSNKNASMLYPDGTISLVMKEQISKQVQNLTKNLNSDLDYDVRFKHLRRKVKKRKK